MTHKKIRWSCNRFESMSFQEWDDEVILFNEESNQTHFLNSFSLEVLKLLAVKPYNLEDLYKTVINSFAIDQSAKFKSELESLLSEFEVLGIIDSH